MNDWKCRNCGFRFIPLLYSTHWVESASIRVVRCPECGSNATGEMKTDDDKPVQDETKNSTDGRIRLDE
jgi:hypothetical protein